MWCHKAHCTSCAGRWHTQRAQSSFGTLQHCLASYWRQTSKFCETEVHVEKRSSAQVRTWCIGALQGSRHKNVVCQMGIAVKSWSTCLDWRKFSMKFQWYCHKNKTSVEFRTTNQPPGLRIYFPVHNMKHCPLRLLHFDISALTNAVMIAQLFTGVLQVFRINI